MSPRSWAQGRGPRRSPADPGRLEVRPSRLNVLLGSFFASYPLGMAGAAAMAAVTTLGQGGTPALLAGFAALGFLGAAWIINGARHRRMVLTAAGVTVTNFHSSSTLSWAELDLISWGFTDFALNGLNGRCVIFWPRSTRWWSAEEPLALPCTVTAFLASDERKELVRALAAAAAAHGVRCELEADDLKAAVAGNTVRQPGRPSPLPTAPAPARHDPRLRG